MIVPATVRAIFRSMIRPYAEYWSRDCPSGFRLYA
jgi:hypothetical protein